MIRIRVFPILALTSLLVASAVDAQSTAVRRDSAGVALITYPADAAGRRLQLGQLVVEIGTAPGDELSRVVSALRTPNGRIVVAERRQILAFHPDGRRDRVVARNGAGPGEFGNLRSMHRHGHDSIVAHDGSQMRFAVFSDSSFVRQLVLMKSEHLYQIETSLIGLLGDGRAIVTSGASIALGDPGPARIERQTFPLVQYERDGASSRLLGAFPGYELAVSRIETGPLTGGFSKSLRLFGASSTFALSGNSVVVVNNASLGLDVLDPTGRLVRRIRRAHVPEEVRPSHLEAYAEERVSAITDPTRKAAQRATHASAPHAPVFPALEPRIVVDAAQRVWLGSYKRPGDREQTWWLFELDGTLVGQLTVPAAYTLTDAGTDYTLGIWRDADGVETIRQYQLRP